VEGNFLGVLNFVRTYSCATDWQEQFLRGLDHIEQNGGIAHLYLHSWEIDELGQWDRLENVFATVSRRNLTKLTNGALFQLWKLKQAHGTN
jgi:hypothetical protein